MSLPNQFIDKCSNKDVDLEAAKVTVALMDKHPRIRWHHELILIDPRDVWSDVISVAYIASFYINGAWCYCKFVVAREMLIQSLIPIDEVIAREIGYKISQFIMSNTDA